MNSSPPLKCVQYVVEYVPKRGVTNRRMRYVRKDRTDSEHVITRPPYRGKLGRRGWSHCVQHVKMHCFTRISSVTS